MFPVHTTPEEFKNAPITLDLCSSETRVGNHVIIPPVFERLCFENIFRPNENAKPAFSKSVFEKLRLHDELGWTVGLSVEIKLRFCAGLVWTVGLTVEIKLRLHDELVWTVGLNVEIKLRLHDGLVWTVGLPVEIKLRLHDGLVWTVGLTVEIKLRLKTPTTKCGQDLRRRENLKSESKYHQTGIQGV